MNDWNPVDLCQCVGSPLLGWITAVLSVGVCVWYSMICRRWYEAAMLSSRYGRFLYLSLLFIFIFCSLAGYGTDALAMVAPKSATIIRLVFLASQNVLCPVFLWYATPYVFTVTSRYESIGAEIAAVALDARLSDAALAEATRRIVRMKLQLEKAGP